MGLCGNFTGKILITWRISQFYSPQTFKIVALKMATRLLFVPVDMSTVVPSFNSTAPTTFFSFITLMLFSFSHGTTIKPILRNVILSKTVEKSDQPLKSAFKDEHQMDSSLFSITSMITWIFWELSLASNENLLDCPIAVSIVVHSIFLTILTGSLHLDDGYLGSMCRRW